MHRVKIHPFVVLLEVPIQPCVVLFSFFKVGCSKPVLHLAGSGLHCLHECVKDDVEELSLPVVSCVMYNLQRAGQVWNELLLLDQYSLLSWLYPSACQIEEEQKARYHGDW